MYRDDPKCEQTCSKFNKINILVKDVSALHSFVSMRRLPSHKNLYIKGNGKGRGKFDTVREERPTLTIGF